MRRLLLLAFVCGLALAGPARAEDVTTLDQAQMRADMQALTVDPFAEAPLRDLVARFRPKAGGGASLDALKKEFAGRAQKGDDASLIVLGRLEEALGHRGEALGHLRRAAQSPTLSARSRAQVAQLLELLNDPADAVAAYDRAYAASKGPEAAQLALHSGELMLVAHNLKEAEKRFTQARTASPNDLELRRRIADAMAAHGALKEAIAELEAVRNLARSTSPAYRAALVRRIGDLHKRNGDWRGAGVAYLESWRLSDAAIGARSDLLAQLITLYRSHGALEELAALAAKGPTGWDKVLAGDVQLARGNKSAAASLYKQALKIDPQLTPARERLLLVSPASPSERVKLQQDLVAARPDNPSYHIDLAKLQFDAKKDDEAVKTVREASIRFSQAPYVQIELGDVLAAHGHVKDALPLYERAVGLDGKNPDYQRALGDGYAKVGDAKRAVDAYVRMLGPAPSSADYERLIALLRVRGYDADVTRLYGEAVARFPSDDDLRRNYASWLTGKNDLQAAIVQWKVLAEKAAKQEVRELAGYQVSRLERQQLLKKE